MERDPSSKNKKQNRKSEQDVELYGDSIDAIPSNEFDAEDDSIISNLGVEAVPVDSELVTTPDNSDVEENSEESGDDHELMNSQYLALPIDFHQKPPSVFAGPPIMDEPPKQIAKPKAIEELEAEESFEELAEESFEELVEEAFEEAEEAFEEEPFVEEPFEEAEEAFEEEPFEEDPDTIICTTDFEEEDSVPDIPTIDNQGILNNVASEEETNAGQGILDSALQPAVTDPDVEALFADKNEPQDSAILAAEAVDDLAVTVEEAMYADGTMSSTFEAESVGEDTFLKATKASESSSETNKVNAQLVSTQDLSSSLIPKVSHALDKTRDMDYEPPTSSSQNMPTQDMPFGEEASSQYDVPDSSPFSVGDVIDNRYKVVDFLGRGGMAFVYKVEHQLLANDKFFALKVLGGYGNKLQEFSKRFKREVSVMMEFSHPHVIPIRDFGVTPDNQPYFTMDYCQGDVVKDLINQQSALDIEVALTIAKQTLEALKEAHNNNIIHRDLKPENIMIEMRNNVPHTYVLDFGIAKSLTTEYTEKLTQGVIGTLLYMSPEQATAQDLTIATDIYSLGATLYHMLAGRAPFMGTQQEVIIKIIQENPLPPSYVRKGISPEIDSLVLKALNKKVDERYASAEEFIEAIDQALSSPGFASSSDGSSSTLQTRQAFTPGDVVNNRYRIVDVLGSGGMGIVYKVEHLELSSSKRFFALKLLDPKLSDNGDFKDRFVREIEMAMEFTHENVIQIRDFGHTNEGHYYYTMDYSRGQTLSRLIIQNETLSIQRALEITRQVLSALRGPHLKNIAHRDLKPDNIIVENRNGKDHALVLDFGIAKILDDNSTQKLTQENAIGTPHYMSPEQSGGEAIDFRTDFYSVGIILFEMLTGKTPFTGSTKEVLVAHMIKKPPRPSQVIRNLPLAVEELILRALEKDPNGRFANAEDFIAAIDNIEQREKKLIKRNKLRKVMRFVSTVFFVLCLSGVAFLFLHIDKENRKIEQKFQVAVQNLEENQANLYLQQLKEAFFGVNTFVFPNKISRLSLQIEYQKLIENEDLPAAQEMYMQIQRMPSSKPDLLIELQEQLDALRSKKFMVYQVVRAINRLQITTARDMLSKIDAQSTNKLKELLDHYDNLQDSLKRQKNKEARRIIELDILPHLSATQFSLGDFREEIRSIVEQIDDENREGEEIVKKKSENAEISLIIAEIDKSLRQGNIKKTASLLKKLDQFRDVSYEVKQKYGELLSQEKRFLDIGKQSGSKRIERYELFLASHPKTRHRDRIVSILRKDLQAKIQDAQQKYTEKKYDLSSEVLTSIINKPVFRTASKSVQGSALTLLGRIYYYNRDKKIFALEKYWERLLGKSLYKSSGKKTVEAKLYMAIAYKKKNSALSKKILLSIKDEFRNLKLTTSDMLQKQAYEEAFKLLIKISSYNESMIKKFLKLYPKNYRYYKLLGDANVKNKAAANRYYDNYLKAIAKKTRGSTNPKNLSKEDREVINKWLGLQDFYPFKKGYSWTYENRNLIDQKIKSAVSTVTGIKGRTFSILEQDIGVKHEGAKYTFVVDKGVIKRKIADARAGEYEVIPQKVSITSRWKRPGLKVKVLGYKIPVKEYRNIPCLKVKLENSNPIQKVVVYEYYAPNIGLVKMERFVNGKKSFETILKKFKSK